MLLIYLLIFTSFLLGFGKLGDIKGFRRVFLVGCAVFTSGSFLCGLAPNFNGLLAFRLIQAVGGAMLYAVFPAIIAEYLPQDLRGLAFGLTATAAGLGFCLGAPLGGFLSTYLSWRWVFFVMTCPPKTGPHFILEFMDQEGVRGRAGSVFSWNNSWGFYVSLG